MLYFHIGLLPKYSPFEAKSAAVICVYRTSVHCTTYPTIIIQDRRVFICIYINIYIKIFIFLSHSRGRGGQQPQTGRTLSTAATAAAITDGKGSSRTHIWFWLGVHHLPLIYTNTSSSEWAGWPARFLCSLEFWPNCCYWRHEAGWGGGGKALAVRFLFNTALLFHFFAVIVDDISI